MSILNDIEIRSLGTSLIDPFDPDRVQPASYDLTLGSEALVPTEPSGGYYNNLDRQWIDFGNKEKPADLFKRYEIPEHGYSLGPGKCLLASTVETLHIPDALVGRIEGKSSLGRVFLTSHVTDGFLDPGFHGQVTLELVNHGPFVLVLRAGMRIAQVSFSRLTAPCERPYGSPGLGSHYQGQKGPTAGR